MLTTLPPLPYTSSQHGAWAQGDIYIRIQKSKSNKGNKTKEYGRKDRK